jgi:hypothetical protein
LLILQQWLGRRVAPHIYRWPQRFRPLRSQQESLAVVPSAWRCLVRGFLLEDLKSQEKSDGKGQCQTDECAAALHFSISIGFVASGGNEI